MFGPISKSVVAGITNLLAILGYVSDLTLLHGNAQKWVVVAIAACHLVLNVLSVYQVPNTKVTDGNTVSEPAPAGSLFTAAAVDPGKVDVHAGQSGPNGQWPTETPPEFS